MSVAPPESEVNDDVTVNQSKVQRVLWEAWLDAWKQVKSKKRNVVLIFGGEICDANNKHHSDQVITTNPEKAISNAIRLIEPALDVAKKVIVLRGTEAHTGGSGWADETIARQIHKNYIKVVKNGRQFSWYECDAYIGGKLFNLAHHTSMGKIARTERDAANHLSADLMMSYGRTKSKFPDYALRGHVHRVSDSGMNFPIRSIICPSWQLHTSFTHRIGEGHKLPEVGLITVDPARGEVEWIKYGIEREKPVFV